MLLEIYCDKFHQKKIIFNKCLSVVLGTEQAHNSIGKSTFLLIVDYAFGGETYSKADDIRDNVGIHEIFFKFKFKEIIYTFCRNSNAINDIWICDENYNKKEQIDLEKYRSWLSIYYQIDLPELSFRNAAGRYIRVYGKDNHDEKRPLNANPKERVEDSCNALLKLFNRYMPIKDAQEQAKKDKNNLDIFKKAQSLNFVDNITTKEDFNKNQKEITRLDNELEQLSENLEKGLLDIDIETSEEAINLKLLLAKTKRARGKISANYKVLEENSSYKFSSVSNSFEDLKQYFPNVNIAHISEIENFHNKISAIFADELAEEKKKLEAELTEIDSLIDEYETKLESLVKNPSLSKYVLSKHASLLKQKENLQKQNTAYEKLRTLKSSEKNSKEQLVLIKEKQFTSVQTQINQEMKELNDTIYNGTCNPPTIYFAKNNYNFYTENDTGTGVACKGLVVFDLAVLKLTKLSILVHDSIILKHISDNAVEGILKLYISSGKQVIIALDKQSSYPPNAVKILNDNSVLRLAPNGQELFGKSWG